MGSVCGATAVGISDGAPSNESLNTSALEKTRGLTEQRGALAGLCFKPNYQLMVVDQICMLAASRVSDHAA
jgi:hypothetical protein